MQLDENWNQDPGHSFVLEDHNLYSHNYKVNILHNNTNGYFNEKYIETFAESMPGCLICTANVCKNRDDKVGQYIHWKIKKTTNRHESIAECAHINTWNFSIRRSKKYKVIAQIFLSKQKLQRFLPY